MRYWDASALVPLVVREASSDRARRWLEEDAAIVTWAWTRVELAGAVERQVRAGALSRQERREHLSRFEELAHYWHEVVDLLAVRARALALLARHPLRAADAAQLAAALLASEDDPSTLPFVCLDERLAEAAEREGLLVSS
ncbi:MAG TPA: type II toxin-antitoxin system VapC family toxin [Thermoanaerobaculia bacterium]|nr:type II toxin-antitoxin system VapC family toxin [Thermoanaerobaculia bacterium]